MYQILAYIKFLVSSTNQHGVHSPFIYRFITKCLYDKKDYEVYKFLNHYRKELENSEIILKIEDLGEGSKVLDKNERRVSKMIKTSSSSIKDTKTLFRVAKYFNSKKILELGTSLGVGSYALSLANSTSNITTIEGCTNTSDFSKQKFDNLEINNTEFIKGDFNKTIKTLNEKQYDLIFFDGHHNKEATISYFETLLSKTNNNSVFVFDDIYWSKGMTEAWNYIKAHNSVSVTVDTFYLGFVFFRKEQLKEHFKIRV